MDNVSPRRSKRKEAEKTFKEIMIVNSKKLIEKCQFKHLRCSTNSSIRKKGVTHKHIMLQLFKNRDKVKNLKAARENSISHTRNNSMIEVEISIRNI